VIQKILPIHFLNILPSNASGASQWIAKGTIFEYLIAFEEVLRGILKIDLKKPQCRSTQRCIVCTENKLKVY
jgi:hypothetical protein